MKSNDQGLRHSNRALGDHAWVCRTHPRLLPKSMSRPGISPNSDNGQQPAWAGGMVGHQVPFPALLQTSCVPLGKPLCRAVPQFPPWGNGANSTAPRYGMWRALLQEVLSQGQGVTDPHADQAAACPGAANPGQLVRSIVCCVGSWPLSAESQV